MRTLLSLLMVLIISSCNQRNEIDIMTGDLYFGFWRIGNYYNQPDSLIEKYESYFSTTNIDSINKADRQLFEQYRQLKKHELLYKPFVEIRIKYDSIVRLYLEIEDYNKIKIHKRQKLQDENKKVRITATVIEIDNKMYYCKRLENIEIMEGKTYQVQRKFRIEDYN